MVTSTASDSFIFSCLCGGIFEAATADYRLRDGSAETGAFQFRARRPENCMRATKAVQQPLRNPRAQTWDQFQSQPVKFFLLAQYLQKHEASSGATCNSTLTVSALLGKSHAQTSVDTFR